jgi:polyphosphate kinase
MHAEQHRLPVERARALAAGYRRFRPQQDLPRPLWETVYLLEECQNVERPLLERLRILGLMATSLDQFFIEVLPRWQDESQPTAESMHWLAALPAFVESTLQTASSYLSDTLLPALAKTHHIEICPLSTLGPSDQQWLRRFFHERVYPLLTPLAIDPGHPFPFISTFSLNFIAQLCAEQDEAGHDRILARIKVPRLLPRFITLPAAEHRSGRGQAGVHCYVQSEEVVRFFLPELFPGLAVEYASLFRVVRALEPRLPKEESLERGVRQRELSLPVVRLDVEQTMPAHLLDWLLDHLGVPPYASFRLPNQIGELQLVDLANLLEGPHLRV